MLRNCQYGKILVFGKYMEYFLFDYLRLTITYLPHVSYINATFLDRMHLSLS